MKIILIAKELVAPRRDGLSNMGSPCAFVRCPRACKISNRDHFFGVEVNQAEVLFNVSDYCVWGLYRSGSNSGGSLNL